jgi:hypothetical protein
VLGIDDIQQEGDRDEQHADHKARMKAAADQYVTNNAGKTAVFIIASWWCHRVYHYSMANYVAILKKGMDMTPGGPDESAVPVKDRLGEQVDLERRVELLVESTCAVMFNYVAQVGLSQQGSAMPSHMEIMRSGEIRG